MAEDKKEKRIAIRAKKCPLCQSRFVYSCLKCKKLLIRYHFLPFIETIISRETYYYLVNLHTNINFLRSATKDTGIEIFSETIPEQPEDGVSSLGKPDSNASSVKVKKSSNIFSAIVRRARRRRASRCRSNEVKELHVSSQNLSGGSTISFGVHVEEVELHSQMYERKLKQWDSVCSETNTSHHSLDLPGKDTAGPLINLIEGNQNLQNQDEKSISHEDEKNEGNEIISAFINFGKPTLNISLIDALQYIQETINNMHENESHLINLITKHIKEQIHQKEIMNSISYHTKLQWEAERRSCSVANDIWMQQLEIGRAQERTLQTTLNSLVKQNRQLQIENENLYRKYEKIARKYQMSPDHKLRYPHADVSCDGQMEAVFRHNEKLQVKLETLFKKIESLEGELCLFQKQNDTMEQQLRNSTIKVQNQKVAMQRLKTDHELEKTTLYYKLDLKDQQFKEATELGDIVLEDIDAIKRHLKTVSFNAEWSKPKSTGNDVTDLIHLCRTCINELSKELIKVHNENILKDRDIMGLQERNAKLQESLQVSTSELESMATKIQENCTAEANKVVHEMKIKTMEEDLKAMKEQLEKERTTHEDKTSELRQQIRNYEKYKHEIKEQELMLEQTKLFMGNITSENCMLKNEVTSLNKLLLETGAGDIKKQIDTNKEEIAQFQEEIQKLQKEKRLLAVEFEGIQNENAVLLQNQEIAYKNLQRQIKELEKVNHQNKHLKEKYETEHHTVQTLQNERMKYLEEKSLLKSIIQQLKGEIAKVPLLEDDLTNVSRKASKLGLIAEYNKQQGEKLKEEIIERDKVITQLKDNVQKLNELQIENAKEKLSLCYELNEVCQLKEKLSEVLNTEVRKNAELGQSKEAIAKSVQKIEEKQKNERSAIRVLLKDIKTLTEEKQELVKENKSLESQINSLSIKVAEKENKINEMNRESDRKDQEIADLRKDTQRLEKCKNEITEKVNIETTKYDMNVRQLKVLIDKLRQENKEYDSTIKYLKNNTEKLQKDLDASRQKEMKAKDMVNQLTIRQKTDEKLIADKLGIINVINMEKEHLLEQNMKITSENEKLSKDIAHLNSLLDKIVNDFQNSIKASEQKEHMFKSEQTESRNLIQQYIRETEELKNMIEKRDKEIFELNKCTENEVSFEKKYSKLKQEMESKLSSLEDHNKSLQIELQELQDEYDVKNGFCKRLQNEIEILKTQLEIIMNQKDEEYEFYKKRLAENARTQEESESKGKKEIQKLEQQLRELTQKMDNEKSAYETLAQIHKDISGKFMKSIKELVDIKNSKQELADELKNMFNSVKQLEQEKAELNKQVFNLSGEIESLNSTVVELREKNDSLQDSYSSAVDKCETLVKKSNMPEYYNFESNDQIRDKIYSLEREVTELRKEIEENRLSEHEMKKEICQFQQEITLLEIQRNDVTLQLHEIEKKFHTEKSISEQLSNTHKLLLGAVIQMRDAGKVDSSDCLHLLHMMSNSNSLSEEHRNSLN